MKRTFMPFFIRLGSSFLMARPKSFISPLTSASGRFQFSLEKAKSVRTFTPSSAARCTELRTEPTPA